MSWTNKVHRQRAEDKETKKKVDKLLKALHEDENYKIFYQGVAEDVWEKESESMRIQLQTVLWCAVRVAMQDEGIRDSKANRILALADAYTGYDMTADEFKDWCLDKTGLEVRID